MVGDRASAPWPEGHLSPGLTTFPQPKPHVIIALHIRPDTNLETSGSLKTLSPLRDPVWVAISKPGEGAVSRTPEPVSLREGQVWPNGLLRMAERGGGDDALPSSPSFLQSGTQ